MTIGAGLGSCACLCAGAVTAVTGFGTVYLNLVRQALARFHKADVKAYGYIRTLSWRIGVGALSAATAEYRVENITEVYAVR